MAVAGMRDIKRHIRSISNIRQITKAMELVASVKMRKARELLVRTRPYFELVEDAVNDIIIHIREERASEVNNKFINARKEVKKTCCIIISADRGLAGSYNVNVIRTAQNHIDKQENSSIITVGQKAGDYFRRRKYDIDEEFTQMSEDPTYADAKSVAKLCMDLYSEGSVDEVYLVYTEFLNTISYSPKLTKLLPLEPKAIGSSKDKSQAVGGLMLYEPSPEEVLDYLVPKYIESMIYGALVESAASEQSARRVAMKNATDNAGELIDELQLEYHRARQASITREIAEIVGGADALGG